MDSVLDRVRSLVRLSASSTSDEEARTSGKTACRLIHEKKILLSMKEPPEDEQSLEYLTEEARVAIDRLQKKRRQTGHEAPQPAPDAQARAPDFSIKDYLGLGQDALAIRCRGMPGCRGNKPCSLCRRFVQRALARAIETELGNVWPEAFRTRLLQALTGYLDTAWENVVVMKRPRRKVSMTEVKKEPLKLRRPRGGLVVIDGGKKP
jgi:hypothetical protein